MQVVLQTASSGTRIQRIQLRADQVAQFGCSDWADFSFRDDAMADIHFEVRCEPDGCVLRNLSPEGETLVNGRSVDTVEIHKGDEIKAGNTTFVVDIEGEAVRSAEQQENGGPVPPSKSSGAPDQLAGAAVSLATVCVFLDLSPEVQELANRAESSDELIASLADQEQFLDALRLRAYLLPKRQAVWWGCVCVRDELGPELDAGQIAALDAAGAWVRDPDEPNRRAAEAKADAVRFQGPGGMLALSAFWSEGSIAAPNVPSVAADERLTCQGVAAALITAAYHEDATKANDRLNVFLKKGKQVSDGEISLPDEA